MRIILTITTLILGHIFYGQSENFDIKFGLYGSYADPSLYQELTINENGKFMFYDRVELGISTKFEGKWKMEQNKLILYDFKNNKRKPIPIVYIYKNDQLCTETKSEFCFKWQDKKQISN